MATTIPVPRFKVADLVQLKDSEEYIILGIRNELGFNVYNLMNTKTGQEIQANSHEMKKILDDILESDESDGEEELIQVEENDNKPRFKLLQPEEIDKLAKKRTEPATDKQTTWAIKIFKGK